MISVHFVVDDVAIVNYYLCNSAYCAGFFCSILDKKTKQLSVDWGSHRPDISSDSAHGSRSISLLLPGGILPANCIALDGSDCAVELT